MRIQCHHLRRDREERAEPHRWSRQCRHGMAFGRQPRHRQPESRTLLHFSKPSRKGCFYRSQAFRNQRSLIHSKKMNFTSTSTKSLKSIVYKGVSEGGGEFFTSTSPPPLERMESGSLKELKYWFTDSKV